MKSCLLVKNKLLRERSFMRPVMLIKGSITLNLLQPRPFYQITVKGVPRNLYLHDYQQNRAPEKLISVRRAKPSSWKISSEVKLLRPTNLFSHSGRHLSKIVSSEKVKRYSQGRELGRSLL